MKLTFVVVSVIVVAAVIAAAITLVEAAQPTVPPLSECVYAKERVEFFSDIVDDPLPVQWKGGASGPPIMVVSTESPSGSNTFVPRYAVLRSEGLTPEDVSTAAGSSWEFVIGRWPIKKTKKVIASSFSTSVVLERRLVNAGTPQEYDRHRVYVLNDGTAQTVTVWLWGTNAPAVISVGPNDPDKYVETVAGQPETLSGVNTVPAPDDGNFVQSLKQFITLKGMNKVKP